MGDVNLGVEYLSVGANRQTAAGDWSEDGTVAFGADTNIALWMPKVRQETDLLSFSSIYADLWWQPPRTQYQKGL